MIFPSLIIRIERWKFNKDYGVYVSTQGNFKDRYKRRLPIKINSGNGYCCVKTEKGLKMSHRLVMLTWRPIPDAEILTVDHLNHNKRDNSLENLEWVTEKENLKRAHEDLVALNKIQKSFVYFVDDNEFSTIEDAVTFASTHLKIGVTCFSVDRVRTILKERERHLGQEHKYCKFVFKAIRK